MAAHNALQDSFNMAEVRYAVEYSHTRSGAQVMRELPWSFVRFYGDDTRYVMMGGGIAADMFGVALLPQPDEAMRNKPFPHEIDRPALVNAKAAEDISRPGPIAVQYFGNI